jgi:hypothetical protein
MDKFPKNYDDLFSSADSFDLATLGFGLGQPEPEEPEEDEPRINPLHDMDSLDFYLWVEEEAAKEVARRKAQQAAAGTAETPKKEDPKK